MSQSQKPPVLDAQGNGQSNQQTIRQLLSTIVDRSPISRLSELLDANMIVYMSGWKSTAGFLSWQQWVSFLRHSAKAKGLENLDLRIESIVAEDDIIHAKARWQAMKDGQLIESSYLACVDYQLSGGKVVTIWTHRANYAFIFGPWVTNTMYFGWLLLKMSFWTARQPSVKDG